MSNSSLTLSVLQIYPWLVMMTQEFTINIQASIGINAPKGWASILSQMHPGAYHKITTKGQGNPQQFLIPWRSVHTCGNTMRTARQASMSYFWSVHIRGHMQQHEQQRPKFISTENKYYHNNLVLAVQCAIAPWVKHILYAVMLFSVGSIPTSADNSFSNFQPQNGQMQTFSV